MPSNRSEVLHRRSSGRQSPHAAAAAMIQDDAKTSGGAAALAAMHSNYNKQALPSRIAGASDVPNAASGDAFSPSPPAPTFTAPAAAAAESSGSSRNAAAAAAVSGAVPPLPHKTNRALHHPPAPHNEETTASADKVTASRSRGPAVLVPTPSRSERKTLFGIDCADLVHFTHWEPGGEHVKHLVVKNVVMKTQKIKYKLPQTRFFSMEFPETQTLSAGMSWTIPITFRPVAKVRRTSIQIWARGFNPQPHNPISTLKSNPSKKIKECYKDVIQFTTSYGRFNLPVKATLPEHVLSLPSTVDFRLCPVKETARRSFPLKNVGELTSAFIWDIPRPFNIIPKTGSLLPGEAVTVVVEFKPEDASVFTATATCTFGDAAQWDRVKVVQALTVYGIGKYSHLAIEPAQPAAAAAAAAGLGPACLIVQPAPSAEPLSVGVFEFGDVFVGKTADKRFTLVNHSVVHANFKIKQAERGIDPYFVFSTLSGSVPSEKSLEIGVSFTPAAAGMVSTEYFDVTTLSGNCIRITCTGRGVGPQVSMNTSVVNFNDVPAGTTVTRPLYLQNAAATTAFYQFLTEQNSIFRIDKPWGTIGPNSSVALTIRFSPAEPINYYRRVYCLVEHQDGIYVDILGTCYNEKRRPATFHPKVVEHYKLRVKNGLWSFGPEHLEEMLKNNTIQCVSGVLSYVDPAKNVHVPEPLDHAYPDGRIASEYFFENTGSDHAVTLLDPYIDFGSCSRYRVIESQVIRIANNTKGKMSCVWILPGESVGEDIFFSVSPKLADILPRSVAEFRVSFRPKTDNSFHGAQLECFVFFKSMRNFRLVNQDTFTPPWCLTPMVAGNTFPPGEDTFIPKIDFGATRLDFPSCHVDRSVYRTVRVSNTGDTPVKFAFLDGAAPLVPSHGGGTQPPPQRRLVLQPGAAAGGTNSTDKSLAAVAFGSAGGGTAPFSVKPHVGILHKNESRLIVFRFMPAEQRPYEQALKCYFNSSLSNAQDIHVRGVGYYPELSFENNNLLCFKPTCVGTVAKRTIKARNSARIQVNFEWKIPAQYAGLVSIEPVRGSLAPNSTASVTCSFSPVAAKSFLLRLPCYFSHDPPSQEPSISSGKAENRATLTVIGKGTTATVVAKPSMVDFGAILVNAIVEKEIMLCNSAECDVFYDLEIYRVQKVQPEIQEATQEDADEASQVDGTQEGDPAKSWNETEVLLTNDIRSSVIDIQQSTDILPARSHHCLKVRACIRDQTDYHFRVYYRMKSHSTMQGPNHSLSPLPPTTTTTLAAPLIFLCDVALLGVHPVVKVTDVRSHRNSKCLLWKHFSIDRFNAMLEAVDPSEAGASGQAFVLPDVQETLDFPTDGMPAAQGGGDGGSAPVFSFREPPAIDFHFGAAAVGSEPAVVHLNLLNPGVVPVDWVFYFPNDLEVEVENWADPGDYTEEQIHTNLILDNALFSVRPKGGMLNPGESEHIAMTYCHDFAGFHKLPVIFKLKNGSSRAGTEFLAKISITRKPTVQKHAGKEMIIYFIGLTVPSDQKCLHFPSTSHTFAPVPICTSSPPIQSFRLDNRGCVNLEYTIDTTPLRALQASEHSFEVFQCLNESGSIPPGGFEFVEWIFRPLEAKEYEVDVPIRVDDGQVHIISFSGKGYQVEDEAGPLDPHSLPDTIPSVQTLSSLPQIASLSLERINFGHVPIGATLRQLVSVRNTSTDTDISFSWKFPAAGWKPRTTGGGGIGIKISPATGSLGPGESKVCKLVYSPAEDIRLLEQDVVCEIVNETEKLAVEAAREAALFARRETRGNTASSSLPTASSTNVLAASASTPSPARPLRASAAALQPRSSPQLLDPAHPASRRKGGSGGLAAAATAPTTANQPDLRRAKYRRIPEIAGTPPKTPPGPGAVRSAAATRSAGATSVMSANESESGAKLNSTTNTQVVPADIATEFEVRHQVKAALQNLLDDILLDDDVQRLLDGPPQPAASYFAQITTERRNGVFLLEGDSRDGGGAEGSGRDGADWQIVPGKREDALREAILCSKEFQNSVESILEGTIFNLMLEADAGEFDITKESLLVWIDQQSS
ncbi:hypothetical protein DFJ73DRAFT_963215 [Zopfochytrium polystomum]|nr:hypothetical protein DFJ73DRAFT_963215 [Zopfochytrium polystomum]